MRYLLFILSLCLIIAPSAWGDYQDGRKAYNRGDYAMALKELLPLAEQGHAGAQYFIGYMYYKGQGVGQDGEEAVKWFRMAAEQGDVKAQYLLGYMYYKGQGVGQDGEEAVKWLRQAAEQDHAKAQFYLGEMYYKVKTVEQDGEEAVKWYRKAADLGLARSQFSLGVMYYEGMGVPKDDDEAVKWVRKAAEQDHEQAQRILPILLRKKQEGSDPANMRKKKFQNQKSLKQLRSAIEEKYSYRDLQGVDWDVRFAEFESRLVDAKTSRQFAILAGQLLEVARDAHIRIKVDTFLNTDGETFASFRRSVRPNVDFDLLKQTVPQFQSINRVVATGRFPEGPAYLMIRSWSQKAARDIEAAAKWIDGLSPDDTLILDIRFNSGGDERLARKIAGQFAERSVVYASHLNRDASRPSGFSEINPRTLKPIRPGFRGRTVVLMGPANMSSCEAFLLMMKQAGAALMGEKSYGSSGNPKPVRLANKVTVFLPSWVALTPDGEPFEGKGISPDVHIEFPDEPGDQDPLINAALELLKGGKR